MIEPCEGLHVSYHRYPPWSLLLSNDSLDWGRADADEGDIVDEVSVRRDKAALVLNANSSCSISELRLHEDLPLLASLHPDDPLVEPWNHLLLPHLESNGLASLARVVKDCSISEVCDVVDDDEVSLVYPSSQPTEDPVVLLLVDVGQPWFDSDGVADFLARLLSCKRREGTSSCCNSKPLQKGSARELLVEAHAQSTAGGTRLTPVSRQRVEGKGTRDFDHGREDDRQRSDPRAHVDQRRKKKP
mmetsp:Transcript_984/g.2172  ORF Transcript_984/g.2172 Transcript_984/m.2172 type:complete len:245 (-) Transcript_984:4-738(-)